MHTYIRTYIHTYIDTCMHAYWLWWGRHCPGCIFGLKIVFFGFWRAALRGMLRSCRFLDCWRIMYILPDVLWTNGAAWCTSVWSARLCSWCVVCMCGLCWCAFVRFACLVPGDCSETFRIRYDEAPGRSELYRRALRRFECSTMALSDALSDRDALRRTESSTTTLWDALGYPGVS